MFDLSTQYMGLKLRNPLVVSASPLSENLDNIRRMEESGAAAVVMHSLFEEQITLERNKLDRFLTLGTDSYYESLSYFPDMDPYNLGPDGYLDHLKKVKQTVRFPVIGSLNGSSMGGWIEYAKWIEDAGADGLELNLYHIEMDPHRTAADVESVYCEIVNCIRTSIHIPLAVKLHPYFSALPNFVRVLEQAGASAVVLFNRFYQPDFDLERLEVTPKLVLSSSQELLLRLHWTAILYGNVHADIAITGGVHSAVDVIKSLMAGARVAMMTSALLKHGISHVSTILEDLVAWMKEHEYDSVNRMRGSMSRVSAGQPAAFERANYMKVLGSYQT